MSERCENCDRPIATDDDWKAHSFGEAGIVGDHLCWGGLQCTNAAVDWRERALELEEMVDKQGDALDIYGEALERIRDLATGTIAPNPTILAICDVAVKALSSKV